jgi:hypothetical protein
MEREMSIESTKLQVILSKNLENVGSFGNDLLVSYALWPPSSQPLTMACTDAHNLSMFAVVHARSLFTLATKSPRPPAGRHKRPSRRDGD